jgi:hypothetical protein
MKSKSIKLISNSEDQFNAMELLIEELERAEKKFPEYPTDIIHRAAIVQEESGELIQACLDLTYTKDTIQHVKEEAVQVGAMAIRFLISLDKMGNE